MHINLHKYAKENGQKATNFTMVQVSKEKLKTKMFLTILATYPAILAEKKMKLKF